MRAHSLKGFVAIAGLLAGVGCGQEFVDGEEDVSETDQLVQTPIVIDPNVPTPTLPTNPTTNPGGGDIDLTASECGSGRSSAGGTGGAVSVARLSRPASDTSNPTTYNNCNLGAIDRANLHWTYNGTVSASTTLRFWYEKCLPNSADPMNPDLCLVQPGNVEGHCVKSGQPSGGRYDKTKDVNAEGEGETTFRIRPVFITGGSYTYGAWKRTNTVGPYNFRIAAPEVQLQDFRSKIPWASSVLSAFANVNIPGIGTLNNINLAPVLGQFNKATFFIKSNDPRSGYLLLSAFDEQAEKNGLYDYNSNGRSVVVSAPPLPFGFNGVAELNYGCWDNRFNINGRKGFTEGFCQALGQCTYTKHEPPQ